MAASIPVFGTLGGWMSPNVLSHLVIPTFPPDKMGGEEKDCKADCFHGQHCLPYCSFELLWQ